jgi:hypothetical protein
MFYSIFLHSILFLLMIQNHIAKQWANGTDFRYIYNPLMIRSIPRFSLFLLKVWKTLMHQNAYFYPISTLFFALFRCPSSRCSYERFDSMITVLLSLFFIGGSIDIYIDESEDMNSDPSSINPFIEDIFCFHQKSMNFVKEDFV